MDQEKIGKFIRDIRKKNNLTQADFAESLGVTFQAVSKWENGKNVPDISILKEISNLYNVNIDEIIDGEVKEKKIENSKKIYFYFGGAILFVILIVILTSLINDGEGFEFKQISTSCDNFNITGSMAYNKDKTSLYISSIEFCGSDDDAIYENIECTLYEEANGDEVLVSSCKSDKNVTLREYLKDVRVSVDNYSPSCDNTMHSELYLEINATMEDNKNIVYKVPITLIDNCNN